MINLIRKLKNYISWGVYDLNEIITDKKCFYWFYYGDNINIFV